VNGNAQTPFGRLIVDILDTTQFGTNPQQIVLTYLKP